MALENPNCYVCEHHTLCYARRHVDNLVERSGLFNENWQQLFVTLAKVCNKYKHAHRFQEPVGGMMPGPKKKYCECGEWEPVNTHVHCTATLNGKHYWEDSYGIVVCKHCGLT